MALTSGTYALTDMKIPLGCQQAAERDDCGGRLSLARSITDSNNIENIAFASRMPFFCAINFKKARLPARLGNASLITDWNFFRRIY